jgi:hypothetical protein
MTAFLVTVTSVPVQEAGADSKVRTSTVTVSER